MDANKQPALLGFLRLRQIVGGPSTPALIPVSKSTWWAGVASGKFPQPLRLGRCTMWRAADIERLLESIGGSSDAR